MGVKGLWQLLEPTGRPVTLESLEGKVLAVGILYICDYCADMGTKPLRLRLQLHEAEAFEVKALWFQKVKASASAS